MRNDPNPFAYEVEPGDRIHADVNGVERAVTVVETVDDQRGFGIVVELDSGREHTIGAEQFAGRI